MSGYSQGRDVEWAVGWHLEEDGYRKVRGSSSKGFADVVCVKPSEALFISCKRSGRLPEGEWNYLVETAGWVGAVPLLALLDRSAGCTRKHRVEQRAAPRTCGIRFVELTGRKIPRALSAVQAWRPWVSDLVVPA